MNNLSELTIQIKSWAKELGFAACGITNCDLSEYHQDFLTWLEKGFHGEMAYMANNVEKRLHPSNLLPNSIRIISVAMEYLPADSKAISTLQNSEKAYISRYALGGDYHKYIRKRLSKLAEKIQAAIGPYGYRAFTDSAPILEKPLAEKAGIGWIGKNTLLLNPKLGSWCFLGELFTDLPLPIEEKKMEDQCGKCTACLNICPTQAFVAPYQLDARRCISYLTIESKAAIPEELRPLMGNRIYGCDDCQLVCPWNRFAYATQEEQFKPRHSLDDQDLIDLFLWDEATFLQKTEGSAIRRIGYECWLRNLAVALGNAPSSPQIIQALTSRLDFSSDLVQEHVQWALNRHAHGTNQREDIQHRKLSNKLNENY